MAAMGAQPRWALLALTIPTSDAEWLQGFAGGLFALADQYGLHWWVAIPPPGRSRSACRFWALCREAARYGAAARERGSAAVTGCLGDAAAGLDVLQRNDRAPVNAFERDLVQRFEYPTPRVQLGLAVRGIASAAMDLSDGLAGDLPKLAQASGLSAHVQIERLPLSAALSAAVTAPRARDFALSGGDDYELLLTVSRQQYQELASTAQRFGWR